MLSVFINHRVTSGGRSLPRPESTSVTGHRSDCGTCWAWFYISSGWPCVFFRWCFAFWHQPHWLHSSGGEGQCIHVEEIVYNYQPGWNEKMKHCSSNFIIIGANISCFRCSRSLWVWTVALWKEALVQPGRTHWRRMSKGFSGWAIVLINLRFRIMSEKPSTWETHHAQEANTWRQGKTLVIMMIDSHKNKRKWSKDATEEQNRVKIRNTRNLSQISLLRESSVSEICAFWP